MANATDRGMYVPITTIFDASYIKSMDVNSIEFKELMVIIRKTIADIAEVLNKKTSGLFELEEFVVGDMYFADPTLNSTTAKSPILRNVFRTTVDFGALPNTALKSVAHGIVFPTGANTFTSVKIYGSASDLTAPLYIPLPYASPVLVNNIEINFDATNVNVTTGSDRTNFTDCKIVLEYIKD